MPKRTSPNAAGCQSPAAHNQIRPGQRNSKNAISGLTGGNKLRLAILVSITLALPLRAQQPPPGVAWRGGLRNNAGRPVSGAALELLAQSGQKAKAVTQPDGGFPFDKLPPLRYSLFVTAGGHRFAY